VNDLKKILRSHPLIIDSWVTRMHSVLTVGILGATTVILTLNSYVGDPIECEIGKDDNKDKVYGDTFCWIYGPRTKIHTSTGRCDHNMVFQDDVGPAGSGKEWTFRSHQFYQWINMTLIMQALFFYLPGWIWGQVEGDRVANVVGEKGLRPLGDLMAQPEEELKKQACKVAKRLSELQGSHRPWAIRLVATELLALCNLVAQFFFIELGNKVTELLALCNLVAQFFFIDHFVGGGFLSLGFDLLNNTECSPGEKLFPIRAACKQFTKGSGGGDQHKGLTCVLTTNMWNRKFYTFLHFWFVVLSVITFIGAIYRILTIFVPSFRRFVERWEGYRADKGSSASKDFSDWLFYSMVLTNCSSLMRDNVRGICGEKEEWDKVQVHALARQATRDLS